MALPMLVNGADCGPSNPLQGLSKQFDRDRGLQQDYFGAGRAGSSQETFRSQQAGPADKDAARFFSSSVSPLTNLSASNAFDLSSIRGSLPTAQMHSSISSPPMHSASAWAADFLQKPPVQSSGSLDQQMPFSGVSTANNSTPVSTAQSTGQSQWNAAMAGYRMGPALNFTSTMPMQSQVPLRGDDQSLWEKEFSSQENSLASMFPTQPQESQNTQQTRQIPEDADELARTAGLLLDQVSGEQNPKFLNSQFLGLMRQLRDRTVVLDGDKMVENTGTSSSAADWASDFRADLKGKGKAVESPETLTSGRPLAQNSDLPSAHASAIAARNFLASIGQESQIQQEVRGREEDPNDAYFRQDNEDYIRHWGQSDDMNSVRSLVQPQAPQEAASWDRLQEDWDNFEATSTGIKALNNYQFQHNNPYLLGDSSRTKHHLMHRSRHLLESVLELEAVVQQNMTDGTAWFELGVKQQENEREQKAIQALQRAVELDPSHLPSYLALAVSYTNDSNRQGTYDAVREWVEQNDKYRSAVQQFRFQNPERADASSSERFGRLIQCLIAMARSDVGEAIDADIQIALAVLLNTNEDYEKAQDCFRTALAVRPDDWQLYNRVGATMANSGRAEEALQYYYRALELNPVYIRARFNLGISCINLRRYEEAAEHILDAIALQDSDSVKGVSGLNDSRGVMSGALWESLKTACMHLQRVDLVTLCDQQDLEGFRHRFLS